MTRFGRAPVRAGRRDANEPQVIAALQAVGAAVQQLDPPLPDLLVSFRGVLSLLEVKDVDRTERKNPHKRNDVAGVPPSLTGQQAAWWSAWKGKAPVVVRTPEEALAAIGAVVNTLPADLLPDALAVHHQRRPKIG